jgi:hypothetical protein
LKRKIKWSDPFAERKFSVWPDKNYFFKRAVNDLVFREITCFLPEGMVVVDFSLDNILYFLHEEWAEKLQETGLKLFYSRIRACCPWLIFGCCAPDYYGRWWSQR